MTKVHYEVVRSRRYLDRVFSGFLIGKSLNRLVVVPLANMIPNLDCLEMCVSAKDGVPCGERLGGSIASMDWFMHEAARCCMFNDAGIACYLPIQVRAKVLAIETGIVFSLQIFSPFIAGTSVKGQQCVVLALSVIVIGEMASPQMA